MLNLKIIEGAKAPISNTDRESIARHNSLIGEIG
jgi:hypothetical protein